MIKPTKRFVIEPSLECNIKCKFCYHLYRYNDWKKTRLPFDKVKKIINAGKDRGNNYMDITGGEPTIYPYICETILYAKRLGIKSCIITNGIVGKNQTANILASGIDDWLVSRHGMAFTHNLITNTGDGYRHQIRFLNQVSKKMRIRFNVVISKFNEKEIEKIAYCLAEWNPRIVNFINMNPHHEWRSKELETKQVIANLRKVEPFLNKAIKYLESKDIGVNVRYYPMCRLAPEYSRCICNDLHVMFDPYEWDYNTSPKTIERYFEWGINTSNSNEEKEEPCCNCDLQNICGGINKHFHKVSNLIYEEVCEPCAIVDTKNVFDEKDFYYFRKDNIKCLASILN